MARRSFPIVYASDVETSARFYERLGFERHFRLPAEGEPGYVGLRRDVGEVAIVSAQWPRDQLGVEPGGGQTAFDDDPRLDQFQEAFPDARTTLELGCLEGGQTVELANRYGLRITAVEGRHANIERARWVSRVFRAKGVTFVEADLEQRPP